MDAVPDGSPLYQRVLVIANGAAGSTGPDKVHGIVAACRSHGCSVTVEWTMGPGDATTLARRHRTVTGQAGNRPDLVISVGGDGTLREVAAGLVPASARSGVPPALLVLPGGTGNSNYRSLWDDLPWTDTIDRALTGAGAELRELDLARVVESRQTVFLGASSGLFAAAADAATSLPISGRARYQSAISSVLTSFSPYPGRVAVDGRVLQEGPTVLVSVGGGRHRAGVLEILPKSSRDDGLLDVCAIGTATPVHDLLELMRTAEHLDRPGVAYAQGRRITIEDTSGAPLTFETDGDAHRNTFSSLTMEIVPAALHAIASEHRPGG